MCNCTCFLLRYIMQRKSAQSANRARPAQQLAELSSICKLCKDEKHVHAPRSAAQFLCPSASCKSTFCGSAARRMFGSKRPVHAKVSQVRLLPKPLHATTAAEQAVCTDQLMPTPFY